MTRDDWETVIDALGGVINGTKALYEDHRDADHGRPETSRASSASRATPGVHYSSSKAGSFGLTKGLAKQLGPEVRVNCVAPGLVETPLLDRVERSGGRFCGRFRLTGSHASKTSPAS